MPIATVTTLPPASLATAPLYQQALRVLRVTAQQWGMCPAVSKHTAKLQAA